VVAIVAPDGGETGMSAAGGSVGIVLIVGTPTGISVVGGAIGMAAAPVEGGPG
jgi:hypothetical protein